MILGGVTLSDDLVLMGLENAQAIAWSGRRTLGGRMIVSALPTPGGRELALQSENHLTAADIAAIRTLFAAGEAVEMSHAMGTFTVLITGIEVEPDNLLSNPGAGDQWFSGVINLIEV